MDANALGIDQERAFPTVSLASADNAQLERLCGPSPVVPHLSDPICCISGPTHGREDRIDDFRKPGGAFVLLAVAALSRAVPVRLVVCAARLLGAVFVSNEHGEGAAICDHLPRHRDSPVLHAEILAVAATGPRLYVDLRPVCALDHGDDFLVDCTCNH